MDSSPSCLATIVLDSQALAEQVRTFERFVVLDLGRLVSLAERQIRRCHVVDPAFGAEDAVQNALLGLCRAMTDGKIDLDGTEEGLMRLLRHALNL